MFEAFSLGIMVREQFENRSNSRRWAAYPFVRDVYWQLRLVFQNFRHLRLSIQANSQTQVGLNKKVRQRAARTSTPSILFGHKTLPNIMLNRDTGRMQGMLEVEGTTAQLKFDSRFKLESQFENRTSKYYPKR